MRGGGGSVLQGGRVEYIKADGKIIEAKMFIGMRAGGWREEEVGEILTKDSGCARKL